MAVIKELEMNTEIIVITDRSGSMATIRVDANGGFDTFMNDQKKIAGECRVTQIMFDDTVETQYVATPLAEVPPLNLQPRGSTALLDAIGMTLSVQGRRIKEQAWAELVIVTIITDGGENASKEYNPAQIKTMVQHAEKHGWKFVFLAANQDAFATGANYGISAASTRSFVASSVGTQAAYASTSSLVSSYRTSDVA